MELDDPVATALPKATTMSWPFAPWVTYILSWPGLVRSIDPSDPLTFLFRGDAYPVTGGNWAQLPMCFANFDHLACSPVGVWVLSMTNYDDKAMDTLGTLWRGNWEVLLSSSAHCPLEFCSNSPQTPFTTTLERLDWKETKHHQRL